MKKILLFVVFSVIALRLFAQEVSQFYPVKSDDVFVKNGDTMRIFIDYKNDALLFCNHKIAEIMNNMCQIEDTAYLELKKIKKTRKNIALLPRKLQSYAHFVEVNGVIRKSPVYAKK